MSISRITEHFAAQGQIVLHKAIADWSRFSQYRNAVMENTVNPIQCFSYNRSGKNGGDIRLTLEVMKDLEQHSDLHTIVIMSRDVDFVPLISELKERGVRVITCGVGTQVNRFFREAGDYFLDYRQVHETEVYGEHLSLEQKAASYKQLLKENRVTAFSQEQLTTLVKATMNAFSENTSYYDFETLIAELKMHAIGVSDKHVVFYKNTLVRSGCLELHKGKGIIRLLSFLHHEVALTHRLQGYTYQELSKLAKASNIELDEQAVSLLICGEALDGKIACLAASYSELQEAA